MVLSLTAPNQRAGGGGGITPTVYADRRSGVGMKFFHNRKMNRMKTMKNVCSDPALSSP